MKYTVLLIGTLLVGLATGSQHAHAGGEEVIVIYNSALPESKAVANYYAKRRAVPDNQVFGFKLSTGADMPRAEYNDLLLRPLVNALTNRGLVKFGPVAVPGTNGQTAETQRRVVESNLRYAVLCYGIPWRIKPDTGLYEWEMESLRPEMRKNEAAVDSELACLAVCERPYPVTGPLSNPSYTETNAAAMHLTNGLLMVSRLDGPTPEVARGLVDKALEAERDGMWGRVYFDLRGSVEAGLQQGEDSLRNAAEICRHLGLDPLVDTNESVFAAGYPMSEISLYAGWYRENATGPFALPEVEFMPGAFAYHLHSFSAANLRSTTQGWVGPFLAKGVTITMGPVYEPYLGGTPDIPVFVSRLVFQGFSFGEAAYAAQNALSWQTTVVGDPLYRPFGQSAQERHLNLEQRRSPLVFWSHLRLANLNLANRAPLGEVATLLENVEEGRRSPIIMEKLGDVYAALGKPSSSAYAYEQALKLEPTPQRRARLSLGLADKLRALDRPTEAYAVCEEFLKRTPDYPNKPAVYRRLVALAKTLNETEAAARYESELKAQPASPSPGAGAQP